ncbi:hypothetical protein E3P77_01030 [Wallemia ichthyophaga]|uniref:Carrier domain-containing protein n=1 Tax=Wallemia ichthyophaga TaxID=245174 RepID=A0A4T0GM35_WALIC|nr:hypothetical protein E3P91_01027 [Wallemia ichthyophaga]TIA82732.1 hypothetical protein E3P98_01221 [Wallemia ichthyophaga]TIB01797.1 hypothetical protein E3P95_01170 [Wallemia ichthyophaga]TIB02799.1 hypothetical protein E3P94_01302 [Wallemia ichthyophaga]TIB12671.1 hypothetical protein E3P93_02208 [Wallemia ichthyophaga]
MSSIINLLKSQSDNHTRGLYFYPGAAKTKPSFTSYASLYTQALNIAAGYKSAGFKYNDIVLLYMSSHEAYALHYWAAVLVGLVPTILTPLTNDPKQVEAHLSHLKNLLDPRIIASSELHAHLDSIKDTSEIYSPEDILARANGKVLQDSDINSTKDLACLMLTSGSTGNAKAVEMRHEAIQAAVRGKSQALGLTSETKFLNWINFDHVANLTECHLTSMYLGADQYHVPGAALLTNPLDFLQIINDQRINFNFSPNFFLSALLDSFNRELKHNADLRSKYDLSSLKKITSGGEASSTKMCATLIEQVLAPMGAPKDLIVPGFGQTETCAGSIFNKTFPSQEIRDSRAYAAVGLPMNGIEMRIVDPETSKAVADGQTGELQIAGPVVFRKYYRNEKATRENFTPDGWSRTGDRAYMSSSGCVLAGRDKDSIITNGVKYFSSEIEYMLENAGIEGMLPSWIAAVPYRPEGHATEDILIFFAPSFDVSKDVNGLKDVVEAIADRVVMYCAHRPYRILALPTEAFGGKSSLGKISRNKVLKAYDAGAFVKYEAEQKLALEELRRTQLVPPETDFERKAAAAMAETLGLDYKFIGRHDNFFTFGGSSLELVRYKNILEKYLGLTEELPLITVLRNPTPATLAPYLDRYLRTQFGEVPDNADDIYDPIVPLQLKGSKPPLFLIHPGVGEVLVFLNLAKYITDRPVYALRARGFNPGETPFTDMNTLTDAYMAGIERTNPDGPYCIAGYSYGACLGFEICKKLEAKNKEIGWFGCFNLPPHIKERMQQLDRVEVVLNLSYFLGLMTEDYAHEISPEMHKYTPEQVVEHIVAIAPPARLQELELTASKLLNWGSIAENLQALARGYEPTGTVSNINVFIADPLAAVAKTRQEWYEKKLTPWKDFTRTEPVFIDAKGAHYTILAPENVVDFQSKMRKSLEARGM